MSFQFVPPDNPLTYWDKTFRPRWTQRTREGIVCYFCRTVVAEQVGAGPCCIAADEWSDMEQVRNVRLAAAWLAGRFKR